MHAENATAAEIRMLEEDLESVRSPDVRAFIQEKIESLCARTESASSSTKHRPSIRATLRPYGLVLVALVISVSFLWLLTVPLIPGGYGQSWMDPSQPTTDYPVLPIAFWKLLICFFSFVALTVLVALLVMFFEGRRDKARSKAKG